MSVKAKLKIILQADDTVVAEVEDSVLWQRVLTAINQPAGSRESSLPEQVPMIGTSDRAKVVDDTDRQRRASDVEGDPVERMAQQLGISRETLEGACSPASAAPFLHLDVHCWEEFKRQTPATGPRAINAIVVAATLLTLWFRAAGLGNPTQSQAQGVLGTIGIEDKNPSRGIQRAEWLQARPGGTILLNPAQVSRAIAIATSFCTKQWRAGGEQK